MVEKTNDEFNTIKKLEDITPEYEAKYPNTADAYKRWFKFKRLLKTVLHPVYWLFLYLSSLGTIFYIFILLMIFFPLIFLFGDFGFITLGNIMLVFESVLGRPFDINMILEFVLFISFIYSIINLLVKFLLEKIFKLEFKIKIYVEMLFFLGIYVVLTIISFIVALIVSNSNILTILWYYIIMFFIGLIFLSYKLLMLMIAKYLKQFIYSE